MTVAQAIHKIILDKGSDILDSPNIVQSMVMDYVTDDVREKYLFGWACQRGVLSYAQDILASKNDNQRKAAAENAVEKLKYDAFLAEEYAILITNMILEGLKVGFCIEDADVKVDDNYSERIAMMSHKKSRSDKYNEVLRRCDKLLNGSKGKDILQEMKDHAKRGDGEALVILGDCYEYGILVEMNWRVAEAYYSKAILLENQEAKYKRNELLLMHREQWK